MKKSLLILLTLFIAYSCGTLSIEKRRYNHGFYMNWSKSSKHDSSQERFDKSLNAQKELVDHASIDSTSKHPIISSGEVYTGEPGQITVRSTNSTPKTTIEKSPSHKTVRTSAKSDPNNMNAIYASRSVQRAETVDLTKRTSSKNTNWFYTVLASIPLMFLFRKKASHMATWATNNKRQSRGLIIALSGMSALSSFSLGTLTGWGLDNTAMLTSLGLIGAATILQGVRLGSGLNFIKNKLSFAMIGSTGAMAFLGLGSRYRNEVLESLGTSSGELVLHPAVVFLLTLLLIAAAAAALYGIAVLACGIACFGSEILAGFVFFGGIFLTVFLFAFAIQYVHRKVDQPTDKFAKNAAIAGILLMLLFVLVILAMGFL